MEVFKVICERRSIRKYRDEPIPEEILERILEAGRLAPSAANRQPWSFIVVKDKGVKSELVDACRGQRFIGEAGAVIAVLGDPNASRWYKQDPFIAASFMTLEAHEEGLGVCWIGAFDEDKVKKVLKIPENLSVIILLTVGFPDEKPQPRPRKPREEIFFLDEYGKAYPFKHQ
ncbi:MAG: nitroreductase family protein [Candidatus Bathyarchaeia archaeon]|nr:nitroreductase family protein [Candidatus Bathyarchaeota archaeon]